MKILLLLIVVLFSFLGGYLAEPKMREQLNAQLEIYLQPGPESIKVQDPLLDVAFNSADPVANPADLAANPSDDFPDDVGGEVSNPEDSVVSIPLPETKAQPLKANLLKPKAGTSGQLPDRFGNNKDNSGVPEVVIEEVIIEQELPEFFTPKSESRAKNSVVDVMKASIASREVSKFTTNMVVEWNTASSTERIDGEIFQTGSLVYQTETPFGTKNLPAKALIKNGKVVLWISPKSGMKIE